MVFSFHPILPAQLPFDGAFLDVLALVTEGLTPGKGNLYLCPAPLEIQFRGYKGKSLFFHLDAKLTKLAIVQQQLARTLGLVVVDVAVPVGRYVEVYQVKLFTAKDSVCLGDGDLAIADGLDFGALKVSSISYS